MHLKPKCTYDFPLMGLTLKWQRAASVQFLQGLTPSRESRREEGRTERHALCVTSKSRKINNN